jgi:hypothetical protein
LLREVYGEDTLSRARVFEWNRRFLGGREDVEDDERPGSPVTMKTDENGNKMRTLVRNNCRLSIRMIAEELNVDKEVVRKILTENLKMKKVCAKMVPKNFSEDQKLNREEKCQTFWKKMKTQTFSTVSSPAMKLGSFDTTQKLNENQCSGKQLTLQDQKMHVCQNPRSRQCSSFSSIFKELL